MFEVISNILKNAITFSERKVTIYVTTETSVADESYDDRIGSSGNITQMQKAIVKIKDNGKGMIQKYFPEYLQNLLQNQSKGPDWGFSSQRR